MSRVVEILPPRDDALDRAARAAAAGKPLYQDCPEPGLKWPRPLRVLFIAGSAALLWAVLYYLVR